MIYRDPRDLLRRIEPMEIDGRMWWRLKDICEALHIAHQNTAYALIGEANRRNIIERVDRFTKVKRCVIDRDGVNRLAIRYGGTVPRCEIMAALDETSNDHKEREESHNV